MIFGFGKGRYGQGQAYGSAGTAYAFDLRGPMLSGANQEWALDFAHDLLAAGRNIRVLSVVDVFTRECLALEVDTGFASRRVTRVLDEVIACRGMPMAIRCDNGPELTSRHFPGLGNGMEDRVAAQPGPVTVTS